MSTEEKEIQEQPQEPITTESKPFKLNTGCRIELGENEIFALMQMQQAFFQMFNFVEYLKAKLIETSQVTFISEEELKAQNPPKSDIEVVKIPEPKKGKIVSIHGNEIKSEDSEITADTIMQ